MEATAFFGEIAQNTVSHDMSPRERADYIRRCWEASDKSLTLRSFFLCVSDDELELLGVDVRGRNGMDERELWWAFRFKDGRTETASDWTPEKVQRAIAAHGPLVGISPA